MLPLPHYLEVTREHLVLYQRVLEQDLAFVRHQMIVLQDLLPMYPSLSATVKTCETVYSRALHLHSP